MFYVGQKVVCVHRGPLKTNLGRVHIAHALEEGQVYTVTEVCLGGKGINVAEARPIRRAFDARRFRPVVERKSDISIFTAMLNPSKVEEPV